MQVINVKNLSKTYWFYKKETGFLGSFKGLFSRKKTYIEAVKEINFQVERGEKIGLIGPNGAGKTTTLKMLSGILHPTKGHIEVLGYMPVKRDSAFLKGITLISGQRNQLFWDLPALEYFNFSKIVYDIPKNEFSRNLEELIQMAEIKDILKIPQRKLSFGQRKRCELVAALLHNPQVVFLDEPTNALDLINAKKIRDFIRNNGEKKKKTILITSHNMNDIERVCDRVIILNHGRLIFDGDIKTLTEQRVKSKQIKVSFDNGIPDKADLIRLGKVYKNNGNLVVIEVGKEEVSKIASYIINNFSVNDISIQEPSLESIIGAIYLEGPLTYETE